MNNKYGLLLGVLGICVFQIHADALFAELTTQEPITYTVALENVPTWKQRGWGIRVNEVFSSGAAVSADPAQQLPAILYSADAKGVLNGASVMHTQGCMLRRTQSNPTIATPSANPTTAQLVIPNPTELLTGSSSYFSLCDFGPAPSNPYQNQVPNLSFSSLQKFNNMDNYVQSLYWPMNFCSLFAPVQASTLNAVATKLYGTLSLKPYYPEGYFHMTLILAAMNTSPYSTYALGDL